MSRNVLPTRALNEYRRRDIATYLSARYYLLATSARSDHWAREVAIDAILARSQGSYLQVQHFKELFPDGRIEHRQLHMPSGSEAIGEAALLDELSKQGREDSATSCVYSYKLMGGDCKIGVFEDYMKGLRARQSAIASACTGSPDFVVQYVDIKKFYPSVRYELARTAWGRLAEDLELSPRIRDVGHKLLTDYQALHLHADRGLPVGPAFSHVVANAVLRPIDVVFSADESIRYFRYVDDIVLVGQRQAVALGYRKLEEHLSDLGLEIHGLGSPKTIEVSARQWLAAAKDFHHPDENESWPGLVFGLKRAFLMRPELADPFASALRAEEFRLPLLDYSRVARESSFISNIRRWAKGRWWRRTTHLSTVDGALQLARLLRERYVRQFEPTVEALQRAEGFERKRLVPRARYLAGRLVYLARPGQLESGARALAGVPELYLHSEVMRAVATGRVERVIELGTNASQATAQPLIAAGRNHVDCGDAESTEQTEAAAAVLCFNGLEPRVRGEPIVPTTELLRFALTGCDRRLMRADNRFVQETACLRGLETQVSHADLIGSAFDEDEAYALDAIDQLQQSASL